MIFLTALSTHNLAYVGDVYQRTADEDRFNAQYLDFLEHRGERHSLICSANAEQAARLDASRLPEFYLRLPFQCLSDQPGITHPGLTIRFENHARAKVVEATAPLVKSALWYLSCQYPRSIDFETLCQMACQQLMDAGSPIEFQAEDIDLRQTLASHLLSYYEDDSLELSHQQETILTEEVTTASANKNLTSSPLAREQFASNPDAPQVINLQGDMLELDLLLANLMSKMDGSRDQTALIDILQTWADKGLICPRDESGEAIEVSKEMLNDLFENSKQRLEALHLLI